MQHIGKTSELALPETLSRVDKFDFTLAVCSPGEAGTTWITGGTPDSIRCDCQGHTVLVKATVLGLTAYNTLCL